MDLAKVARCRALAAEIASDVQRYVDAHTTVGVERTILRAYGADGVDDQGVPLVNTAVERYREAGLLGRGIAFFLGRALVAGARTVQDAAERLAFASQADGGDGDPGPDDVREALRPHTDAALARIDRARDERQALARRFPPGPSRRETSTTTRCRPRPLPTPGQTSSR
jgi:beta-lysine 5,6-aminomutase alpha subunit